MRLPVCFLAPQDEGEGKRIFRSEPRHAAGIPVKDQSATLSIVRRPCRPPGGSRTAGPAHRRATDAGACPSRIKRGAHIFPRVAGSQQAAQPLGRRVTPPSRTRQFGWCDCLRARRPPASIRRMGAFRPNRPPRAVPIDFRRVGCRRCGPEQGEPTITGGRQLRETKRHDGTPIFGA